MEVVAVRTPLSLDDGLVQERGSSQTAHLSMRARTGLLAIASLGSRLGARDALDGMGAASEPAQVQALAAGQAEIDRWHWETKGQGLVRRPLLLRQGARAGGVHAARLSALDAAGAKSIARDAAANAREADHPRWAPPDNPDVNQYAYSPERAHRVEVRVENRAPIVWALTLLGAVIPAVALLLLVRWIAERIEPGYGTAAAITLGLGTIVMTFAAEYFPHVIAATLGFAAFALRSASAKAATRLALVGAAGLLAGLAVSFEYPLGMVGAILLAYVLTRRRALTPAPSRRLRRRGLDRSRPALAFNLWALCSPLRFAYSYAVSVQGLTGHAELGLNSNGFFGIELPRPGRGDRPAARRPRHLDPDAGARPWALSARS